MELETMCFVLRAAPYQETDKILTLFSRDHGRMDARARGCRKQGSPLLACTEPLVCADFLLRNFKDRYFVQSASLRENFFDLRADLPALCTASVLLEACERCVMPEQPEPRLFSLLAHCLYGLEKHANPAYVFVFFVWKLLDILGQRPVLDRCVHCGSENVVRLSLEEGGVLCEDCPGGDPVSPQLRASMAQVYRTPASQVGSFEPPAEAARLCVRWLPMVLGSSLRTFPMFLQTVL